MNRCSSKKSAITRASDDYYPKNPNTQTLHIAAVAYNSIFFGEVVVPDWDMFYVRSCHALSLINFLQVSTKVCEFNSITNDLQSRHNAAEYHAIARAVGGCGVYVR